MSDRSQAEMQRRAARKAERNGVQPKATQENPAQGKRSVHDIMEDLNKPIPERLLETKPATGKGNQMLPYCPWHRTQKIINHYTEGFCSYEVRERTLTDTHILLTVRITIYAKEGAFHRDGTGLEKLSKESYGDFQSTAESMAFRRAAARFGLGLHLYDGD